MKTNMNMNMKIAGKYWLVLILSGITSCGEKFLEEKPLDTLITSNAFSTSADFTASVNNLYALVRTEFYTANDSDPMQWLYRTDMVFLTMSRNDLVVDFDPTAAMIKEKWASLYKIVAEANTILSRLPASQVPDSEKPLFEAKARFFRAFAYRTLAYLYGGVLLITEEIVGEKVDFTRASRKEIYAQVIADLTFSAQNLKGITAVKDGEISNLAAQHLLAEVYLADGQHQKAIEAATVVIKDPSTSLMTERFGARTSVTPGDVYWDLFQIKNQNRDSGNKEGIWVIQIEADVVGGSALSISQKGSYLMERVHAPLVRDFAVYDPDTKKNIAVFSWPTGDYTGGRGVGYMAPSPYMVTNIWVGAGSDFRNANHNFVRKMKSNNKRSPLFGKEIDFDNLPPGSFGYDGAAMTSGKADRAFYPYQSKCTQLFNHPSGLYLNPPPFPYALTTSGGGTYADQYMFRLAETYLLRAEGYLGLGRTTEAAADINVVRTRSKAPEVSPDKVNIDYILDERIREFGVEEKRILTLMRLGKLYDRIKLCNPYYANSVQPYHNLWPIPQTEIERNRGVKLEQNPGYTK